MKATNNYYQILQVRFDAEPADIISSYKRLVKLYHPDISTLPHAEELMSQINIAYDTLRDDQKRRAYNNSLTPRYAAGIAEQAAAEAQAVLTDYFDLLLQGRYERAYLLLCASDRQSVSAPSFIQWRQAVQELYGIREFNIRRGQHIAGFKLGKNRSVSAVKFFVDVLEKDHTSGRLEHYCFTKYVVFEQGSPGVYLGYRDLSEISKQFGSKARELEKDLMKRHWQEHISHFDRLTGLPTREGLIEHSKRELHRAQRYGSPLMVAVFRVQPSRPAALPLKELYMEALAQTLKKALRLTDIPAYLGEGNFAVLFCELKRRHAGAVIERLMKKAEQAVTNQTKSVATAAYSFEPYVSGPLEPYLQRLAAQLDGK